METNYWTVAYRATRTRGVFHRVSLALDWHQAQSLAGYLESVLDVPVWYLPNAEYDAQHPDSPDSGTILVPTGKRIPVKDDGTLPFTTADQDAELQATRQAEQDEIIRTAILDEIIRTDTDVTQSEYNREIAGFLVDEAARKAEAQQHAEPARTLCEHGFWSDRCHWCRVHAAARRHLVTA